MAELLVRTIDKDQPDLYLACQCLGRGDIVVVCEDGHKWSDTERNSPHWTIIEVPGASVDDFSHFMTPEPGDRKLDRMLRRRPFTLDLDAFEAKHKIDLKQPATKAIAETKAALDQIRIVRAKLDDPNVLK